MGSLFDNFYLNQCVQIDFAERASPGDGGRDVRVLPNLHGEEQVCHGGDPHGKGVECLLGQTF